MHPRYVKLPYSSHSSPEELEAFVEKMAPEQIFFNLSEADMKNTEDDDGLEYSMRKEYQERIISWYTKQGEEYLAYEMYKDLGDGKPEEKFIEPPIDLYPESTFHEIDDI